MLMFRFADDIVFLISSEEDLQMALNIINNTFKDYNLKINATKTKTLVY
jgi:hypothetical protein